jgi:hypothetical protein
MRATTLEAFQRVAALMTFPEHKGIENAATIRDFIAARLPEPLVYPNVAGKLGSVGAGADRVVDFYTRRTVLRDSILTTPVHGQPEYAVSGGLLNASGGGSLAQVGQFRRAAQRLRGQPVTTERRRAQCPLYCC